MLFLGVARVAKNPGEMYWISSPKGQTQLFDELSQDYDRQEMIIFGTQQSWNHNWSFCQLWSFSQLFCWTCWKWQFFDGDMSNHHFLLATSPPTCCPRASRNLRQGTKGLDVKAERGQMCRAEATATGQGPSAVDHLGCPPVSHWYPPTYQWSEFRSTKNWDLVLWL